VRGAILVHGKGAPRQDDALQVDGAQHLLFHQTAVHLTVHIELPHTAGNNVTILTPKITNHDRLAGQAKGIRHFFIVLVQKKVVYVDGWIFFFTPQTWYPRR
jgi:hypothetical protein